MRILTKELAKQLSQDSQEILVVPSGFSSIGEGAYQYRDENIENRNINSSKAIIPPGITRIERDAFEEAGLSSVTIPSTVTFIGEGAFDGNRLTEINLPAGLTEIADTAFEDNELINLTLPNGITKIGEDAFFNNSLSNLVIPDSVKKIKGGAFRANDFTSVIIPSQTQVFEHVFDGDVDVKYTPSDLSLSVRFFNENIGKGSFVSSLSTKDRNFLDTHSYSLIDGPGAEDNAAFRIVEDQLQIIDEPDFDAKSTYSVRIQSKDSEGLVYAESFTLHVNEITDSITGLTTKPESFRVPNPWAKGASPRKPTSINDFDSASNTLSITRGEFNTGDSPHVAFAKNKKDVKKLARKSHEFIYDKKKGMLYFNENSSGINFGNGGLIAILKGAPELTTSNVEFI